MNHQVISPDVMGLDPEDLSTLRSDLLAQHRFHLASLRDLLAADTDASAGPGDKAARHRRTASARMMLHDVEAALARIDEGRYGTCQTCADPLPRAHLALVPHARYCGRCRRRRGTRP